MNPVSSALREQEWNATNSTKERCFSRNSHTYGIVIAVCLISVVGFILNTVLLLRIIKDKKLHCITFAVIGLLAASDLLYIVMYSSKSTIDLGLPCNPSDVSKIIVMIIECVMMGSWFSSSLHTVLISFVRFLILSYPLRSIIWLTKKKIILASIFIWIFSLTNGSTFFLFRDYLFVFIFSCYFISVLLITIFHLLKLINLRKARIKRNSSNLKKTKSMSRMVTVVIVLFIILPLPFLIGSIIMLNDQSLGSTFDEIGTICLTINSTINPVIYGLMSVPFRQSSMRMLNCKKTHTGSLTCVNSRKTNSFQMSERKIITLSSLSDSNI